MANDEHKKPMKKSDRAGGTKTTTSHTRNQEEVLVHFWCFSFVLFLLFHMFFLLFAVEIPRRVCFGDFRVFLFFLFFFLLGVGCFCLLVSVGFGYSFLFVSFSFFFGGGVAEKEKEEK